MSSSYDDENLQYCDRYSMKTAYINDDIVSTVATPQHVDGIISMRRYVIVPKEKLKEEFPAVDRCLTDQELTELLGLEKPITWWKHIGFRSKGEKHILLLMHEQPGLRGICHCNEKRKMVQLNDNPFKRKKADEEYAREVEQTDLRGIYHCNEKLEMEQLNEYPFKRKKADEEYDREVEHSEKMKQYRGWIEREERKKRIARQAARKANLLPPLPPKKKQVMESLILDDEDLFEDYDGVFDVEEGLVVDDAELFEGEDCLSPIL